MSSHLRRRSVNDLTLVGKKRCEKERIKRHKVEEALEELESSNLKPIGEPDHLFQPYNNGCIVRRSSWLQRKFKDTLRLMSDSWTTSYEVTIKPVQRKKNINCLLYASKALDENPDSQHRR